MAVFGRAPRSGTEGQILKVDFKTLKMMELRNSPGEVLDRVARDGEVFVVERSGQPLACLVPVSFLLPDIAPERIAKELSKLDSKNESFKLTVNDMRELEISFVAPTAGENIVIRIVLPHGYPNSAPRIYAAQVAHDAPKRWPDGSLSIFGATAVWNAKVHDAFHALTLARGWLKYYAKWRKTGEWPEGDE
jgi:prevent-host-death family protein